MKTIEVNRVNVNQKLNKMETKNEEKRIIVAFHIGRGGKFHNPGHVSFLGEKNINDLINEQSNHLFYQNKDKKGRFCAPFYSDLNGNPIITEKEAKTGTGMIDFDGEYDSFVCDFVDNLSEESLNKVNDCNTIWKSRELIDQVEKLLNT